MGSAAQVIFGIGVWSLCVTSSQVFAEPLLDNGTLVMDLAVSPEGVPYIRSVSSKSAGDALLSESTGRPIGEWAPASLGGIEGASSGWAVVDHPVFLRAEAVQSLSGKISMTWIVDLAKQGTTIRLHVKMKNTTPVHQSIEWFPIWTAFWDAPGFSEWLRCWRGWGSRKQQNLANNTSITLHNDIHSSDSPGEFPYWVSGGEKGALYFGLDWCGGWDTQVTGRGPGSFSFASKLPPAQTQLTLQPREEMVGPVLNITFIQGTDDPKNRAEWMRQREQMRKALYNLTEVSYPLAYNHWYSVRKSLNEDFFNNQLPLALDTYGVDAMIIDDGWFQSTGDWTPHTKKFSPGGFANKMRLVKNAGIIPGIWSSPQLSSETDPNRDEPGHYNGHMNGYLLDMAGMDFTQFLLDHVSLLRKNYSAGWWKYDQAFFTEQTRHGQMKNVVAFQNALKAVRKADPDLIIENCQSGGRMINEFTTLLAQVHWVRDGGGTGPGHAKENIRTALAALDFLPPRVPFRWTNNPDRNDPADDEFIRMYCRSAMVGVWGISADLSKIGNRQRDIIVKEIKNYRRLNRVKGFLYQIYQSREAYGIVYYDSLGRDAGILLIRNDDTGAFTINVDLKYLSPHFSYRVEDVDKGAPTVFPGKEFQDGLTVDFDKHTMSRMLFLTHQGSEGLVR